MDSQKKNKYTVVSHVEDAVYAGSAAAANHAAKKITDEFILIRKADLPNIEMKQQGWGSLDVPMARSAGYRGRNPKVYWERALDFISVALHAEDEEVKQAEQKLEDMRKDAHAKLFPFCNYSWEYSTAEPLQKRQIDHVVDLMRQVDELKDKK